LLKFPSQDRVELQGQLQRLREVCPPKVRLAVDVDPLNFG
jgi:primosomal protein N'